MLLHEAANFDFVLNDEVLTVYSISETGFTEPVFMMIFLFLKNK